MSYVDFIYKKWLVDVAKGATNLDFEEYLALFNEQSKVKKFKKSIDKIIELVYNNIRVKERKVLKNVLVRNVNNVYDNGSTNVNQ